MPKLTKEKAKKVAGAERQDFSEALPEGRYLVFAHEVTTKEGSAGPYWRWVFKTVRYLGGGDEDYADRQHFMNTSLSDSAAWKLQEVFDAYGVPYDTDTEDLLGSDHLVVIHVSQQPIEKGARKGEMGNNVDRVVAYNGDGGEEDAETDDDLFDEE